MSKTSVLRRCCLGALFAALWILTAVQAEDPAQPPQGEVRIARLINLLGSDSYTERKHAAQELRNLGATTRAHLEQAAHRDDPQIMLGARELLNELKLASLWSASRVECRSTGEQASKLLAEIAEQTGNRLLIGDQFGTFRDGQTQVSDTRGEFWPVIDAICRQTGNQVRPHYDTTNPGLVVVGGDPGQCPVAYAGPVRAQVTGARRQFVEELDYKDRRSELTHNFQLNLQVMWEDRFKLVAYRSQPELVEAVTDTQAVLTATQSTGNGWNVATPGTRQLAMNLRLTPPPIAARELDTLRIKWGLIAVGDMASLEIDDLDYREPYRQDDVELVIENCQTQGPRCELTVLVVRDLLVPEPQEVVFQENQFELFDAADRPFRSQGQTNVLSDQGARIRMSFSGAAPDSVPKRLRLVYPRLRSQQDLVIEFRHVPLPVGKPQ